MVRRLVVSLAALALAAPALAEPLPKHVGGCADTKVLRVETRLIDGLTGKPTPGSGSAIELVDGGYQVSYDTVAALEASRPGDPVRVCLVSIPQHCPPGDKRGRVYETTNLRTHGSWRLPDAEHSCGGA
jgi:hypothetical protein